MEIGFSDIPLMERLHTIITQQLEEASYSGYFFKLALTLWIVILR
jgi:hypothetical protein